MHSDSPLTETHLAHGSDSPFTEMHNSPFTPTPISCGAQGSLENHTFDAQGGRSLKNGDARAKGLKDGHARATDSNQMLNPQGSLSQGQQPGEPQLNGTLIGQPQAAAIP
mmetsp:Transcript_15093/g.40831  ORF Transcript_15093/g.40831 Transcript_15093/m.40831 type:complete len:110 (+) Transcript_15093:3214-3543(+)|eukprot:1158402-Pelagomonas_calceolata.AAC.7